MINLNKKKIIIGVFVIVVAFILFTVISNKNRPVEVTITKAEVRDLVKTISLSGEIKSEAQINLSFPISGIIRSIQIKVDDTVKKGDILANLDTASLYNSYLSQQALYEKSKSSLKTFVETYQDDPDLAYANSDDIYWSKYNELVKTQESAKALMNASLNGLSNAYIKSPIDGVITKLNLESGEFATAGAIAMQVSNLQTLYFSVNAAQEDIGQLKLDQVVKVELDTYPDKLLKGIIYNIANIPSTDATGTSVYEIKIRLEGDLPEIKLGMEGSGAIVLENKISRLSIDSSAITETNDEQSVFVEKNGVAKKIVIKTDFEGDTYIEITEGLNEGDKIILSPLSKIKNGKKVSENGN
ncbi:MAG: efflux RND transporter periplasmic adaptor subunit [bacterium]